MNELEQIKITVEDPKTGQKWIHFVDKYTSSLARVEDRIELHIFAWKTPEVLEGTAEINTLHKTNVGFNPNEPKEPA